MESLSSEYGVPTEMITLPSLSHRKHACAQCLCHRGEVHRADRTGGNRQGRCAFLFGNRDRHLGPSSSTEFQVCPQKEFQDFNLFRHGAAVRETLRR